MERDLLSGVFCSWLFRHGVTPYGVLSGHLGLGCGRNGTNWQHSRTNIILGIIIGNMFLTLFLGGCRNTSLGDNRHEIFVSVRVVIGKKVS